MSTSRNPVAWASRPRALVPQDDGACTPDPNSHAHRPTATRAHTPAPPRQQARTAPPRIVPLLRLPATDRGATWSITPVPFKMGGNEAGRGLGERLASDPQSTNILYFASRHDGLQKSTDHAQTWQKLDSFPLKGLGTPAGNQPTHG